MVGINEAIASVKAIMNEHEGVYRELWREFDLNELLVIAGAKVKRAKRLLGMYEKEGNIEAFKKAKDDVIDACAYLLFALVKIKEEEGGK